MASTRRSTRQSAAKAPIYTEDRPLQSEKEAPRSNDKNKSRRKRAREDEEDADAKDIGSPAPKKAAKSKSESKPKPKRLKPASIPSTATPKPVTTPKAPPPVASSDTNRDKNGEQEVYWLLKAEPLPRYENGVNVAFSIDDLQKCTEPEPWTGVRNPQARNNMQSMREGDMGLFYHSNAKPSGVVGILRVVEEAKVDESAFDPKDPYYDPKSDKENPKWYCVGVEFVKKFDDVVDLHKIKSFATPGGPLASMQLVTNSRLSVSRVRRDEWDFIIGLAEDKGVERKISEGQ